MESSTTFKFSFFFFFPLSTFSHSALFLNTLPVEKPSPSITHTVSLRSAGRVPQSKFLHSTSSPDLPQPPDSLHHDPQIRYQYPKDRCPRQTITLRGRRPRRQIQPGKHNQKPLGAQLADHCLRRGSFFGRLSQRCTYFMSFRVVRF